ncbi:hypothetical protein JRQ81_016714, partial [Phrynocephalus forsythii]
MDKSKASLERTYLSVEDGLVRIFLSFSKTDQKSHGQLTVLQSCHIAEICPVRVMTRYLAWR